MNEQFEEVEAEDLQVGDVVHVSFGSGLTKTLYLNEKVTEDVCDIVYAESRRGFFKAFSRFYVVEKAKPKRVLPTELGAVVKHPDGWQFIRIGDDLWKGVSPAGTIARYFFSDVEIESNDWEVVA